MCFGLVLFFKEAVMPLFYVILTISNICTNFRLECERNEPINYAKITPLMYEVKEVLIDEKHD